MKRCALLLGALPLAFFLAACKRDSNVTVVSPADQSVGITVSGVGEVDTPPDIAVFTVGVEVRSASVGEARDRAAQLAAEVIAAVKGAGVADADVQTSALSIQPEYNYPSGGGQPTIVGYIVANQLSVKVRDLERLNATLDRAVAAGGDAARLQGIGFDVDDDTEATRQAREKAMADARAKAEQLASLAGVRLGEPLAVSEDVQGASPVVRDVAMFQSALPAAGAAFDTPIERGTNTVRVSVAVRWAIAR